VSRKPVTGVKKPVTKPVTDAEPVTAAVEPVTLPRRGRRGPKPTYASNADRQRAYRERKRA
jgi:hypothetical protein